MSGEKKAKQSSQSNQKSPAAKEKPKVESASSTRSSSHTEQPGNILGSLRRRLLGRPASVGYSVLSNFDPDAVQSNEGGSDTDQQPLERKESNRTKSKGPQSKEQRPQEEKKAAGGLSPGDAFRPLAKQKKSSNTFGLLKKFFQPQSASQSHDLPSPPPVSPEKLRDAEELLKAIRGPYGSEKPPRIILKFKIRKVDVFSSYYYLVSTLIASEDIEIVFKQLQKNVEQFNGQSNGTYKLTVDYEDYEDDKPGCLAIEDIPADLLKPFLEVQSVFVPSQPLSGIFTPHDLSGLLAVQLTPGELSTFLAIAVRSGNDGTVKKLLGKKAVINEAVLDSLFPLPKPHFDKMLKCLYPSMSPEFLSETVPRKIKNLFAGRAVSDQENMAGNCIMFLKQLLSQDLSKQDIAKEIASSIGYSLDLIFHDKGVRVKLTPLKEKEKKDDREVVSTSASSSRITASSSFSSRNQRVQTHTSSSSEESEAGQGQVDDATHSFAPSSLL